MLIKNTPLGNGRKERNKNTKEETFTVVSAVIHILSRWRDMFNLNGFFLASTLIKISLLINYLHARNPISPTHSVTTLAAMKTWQKASFSSSHIISCLWRFYFFSRYHNFFPDNDFNIPSTTFLLVCWAGSRHFHERVATPGIHQQKVCSGSTHTSTHTYSTSQSSASAWYADSHHPTHTVIFD